MGRGEVRAAGTSWGKAGGTLAGARFEACGSRYGASADSREKRVTFSCICGRCILSCLCDRIRHSEIRFRSISCAESWDGEVPLVCSMGMRGESYHWRPPPHCVLHVVGLYGIAVPGRNCILGSGRRAAADPCHHGDCTHCLDVPTSGVRSDST